MKKDKNKIPKGDYCYDENGVCPYWSIDKDKPEQENGCCSYLLINDYDENKQYNLVDKDNNIVDDHPMVSLLWDQVKECGINKWTDTEWDELIKSNKVTVVKTEKEINLKPTHFLVEKKLDE